MAVDSLRSVAGLLTEAYAPLHAIMGGRTDVPEAAALDTFFTTVKATADVRSEPCTAWAALRPDPLRGKQLACLPIAGTSAPLDCLPLGSRPGFTHLSSALVT